MRKNSNRLVVLIIALSALSLATPTVVTAEVPSVMNFQAILLDDQGQIVPDSTYDIVFTIHPDSVSFPPEIVVWTELKTVETSGGLFNTMLGTNSPLTAEVFDGERWLQMRLTSSAQPFLPRTRIGATPYSYRVESIDKSSGGEVSGLLNPDSLQVGRSGFPGVLSVVQNTGTVAISMGQYSSQGYSLDVSDELSNYHTRIMPDGNGEGGVFSVRRNATSGGFAVDGNYNNTQEPLVSITGSTRATSFDMSATGSESVELPVDAIEGSEIKDEPGIACEIATNKVGLPDYGYTTLSVRSIASPTLGGYVYANATVQVTVSHMFGRLDSVLIGLSDVAGHLSYSQRTALVVAESAPTGVYASIVSVSGVFESNSMGTTVYLIASDRGSMTVVEVQQRTLVLMYFPTAYGVVDTSPDETAWQGSQALTPAEERLTSVRVNTERIEREMADMKARLLELERSMTEQESDNPQR